MYRYYYDNEIIKSTNKFGTFWRSNTIINSRRIKSTNYTSSTYIHSFTNLEALNVIDLFIVTAGVTNNFKLYNLTLRQGCYEFNTTQFFSDKWYINLRELTAWLSSKSLAVHCLNISSNIIMMLYPPFTVSFNLYVADMKKYQN